jgi:hypothetical protein
MVEYSGKYRIFDVSKIETYSLFSRPSKVKINDLKNFEEITNDFSDLDPQVTSNIQELAKAILKAKRNNKKVIIISGAHIIKNGLGTFLIWLMENDLVDHIGVNGAFTIHDFELAFAGMTSESIPNALSEGKFGFAKETGEILNKSIIKGNKLKLGYGETLGRLLLNELQGFESIEFPYRDKSVIYNAYKHGVPLTVHIGIGTDINQMHPSFDGAAAGACSTRDFLIMAESVSKLEDGVLILIGSAVTGVEVFLKAISMAANIGKPPYGLTTADFDIRDAILSDADDEDKPTYYFRDIKSIVVRIPKSFKGKGYYIKGDQRKTIPFLWKQLLKGDK